VTTPRVSCVIAVHDGERFLAEAIDSVLDQSYAARELIVVDDGSTDGTADLARGYGNRLRYVHQSQAGQAAAMNRGIEEGRGSVFAFLDADDRWRREKLEVQIRHLDDHPETAAVFAHIRNFWADEMAEEAERLRGDRVTRSVPAYMSGTMVARREAFDRVGRFDTSIAHGNVPEWVLLARAEGLRVDLLDNVLLDRRLHRANQSRLPDKTDDFLHLVKRELDRKRGR